MRWPDDFHGKGRVMHIRSGQPAARLRGKRRPGAYSGRADFFFFVACLRKLTPISSPLTQASSQRRSARPGDAEQQKKLP